MKTFEIEILYKDANILVINKPSSMAVHKGRGNGPCLTPYLEELTFGLPNIPQLAHRLDAGTSGCLVLGRHKQALIRLGKLFQNSEILKNYTAIVENKPSKLNGTISIPLAKQSKMRHTWWMKADPNGQEAVTNYECLGTFEVPWSPSQCVSLLSLNPITGRTHQLRVHCAEMNLGIIGDAIYNKNSQSEGLSPYLHLHAQQVTIPYYGSKKAPITVIAPLPSHMIDTLTKVNADATLYTASHQ